MVITGAIFDMDGTLLNSMDYWAVASSEYLVSQGITPFSECDKHFLEDGMRVWYDTAVSKGLCADYQSVSDGIYAINYKGAGFVKRLQKGKDCVHIISDNKHYAPMCENSESEDFRIIGKIRYVVHKV